MSQRNQQISKETRSKWKMSKAGSNNNTLYCEKIPLPDKDELVDQIDKNLRHLGGVKRILQCAQEGKKCKNKYSTNRQIDKNQLNFGCDDVKSPNKNIDVAHQTKMSNKFTGQNLISYKNQKHLSHHPSSNTSIKSQSNQPDTFRKDVKVKSIFTKKSNSEFTTKTLTRTSSSEIRHAKLSKEILEFISKNESEKEFNTEMTFRRTYPEIEFQNHLLKLNTKIKHNVSICNHGAYIDKLQPDHRKARKNVHKTNNFTEDSIRSPKARNVETIKPIVIDDSTYVCPDNSEDNDYLVLPYVPHTSEDDTYLNLSPNPVRKHLKYPVSYLQENIPKSSKPCRLQERENPQNEAKIRKSHQKATKKIDREKNLPPIPEKFEYMSHRLDRTWESHSRCTGPNKLKFKTSHNYDKNSKDYQSHSVGPRHKEYSLENYSNSHVRDVSKPLESDQCKIKVHGPNKLVVEQNKDLPMKESSIGDKLESWTLLFSGENIAKDNFVRQEKISTEEYLIDKRVNNQPIRRKHPSVSEKYNFTPQREKLDFKGSLLEDNFESTVHRETGTYNSTLPQQIGTEEKSVKLSHCASGSSHKSKDISEKKLVLEQKQPLKQNSEIRHMKVTNYDPKLATSLFVPRLSLSLPKTPAIPLSSEIKDLIKDDAGFKPDNILGEKDAIYKNPSATTTSWAPRRKLTHSDINVSANNDEHVPQLVDSETEIFEEEQVKVKNSKVFPNELKLEAKNFGERTRSKINLNVPANSRSYDVPKSHKIESESQTSTGHMFRAFKSEFPLHTNPSQDSQSIEFDKTSESPMISSKKEPDEKSHKNTSKYSQTIISKSASSQTESFLQTSSRASASKTVSSSLSALSKKRNNYQEIPRKSAIDDSKVNPSDNTDSTPKKEESIDNFGQHISKSLASTLNTSELGGPSEDVSKNETCNRIQQCAEIKDESFHKTDKEISKSLQPKSIASESEKYFKSTPNTSSSSYITNQDFIKSIPQSCGELDDFTALLETTNQVVKYSNQSILSADRDEIRKNPLQNEIKSFEKLFSQQTSAKSKKSLSDHPPLIRSEYKSKSKFSITPNSSKNLGYKKSAKTLETSLPPILNEVKPVSCQRKFYSLNSIPQLEDLHSSIITKSKMSTNDGLENTKKYPVKQEESVFLSDSYNRTIPIQGVAPEISDFIRHLLNRIEDCDENAKILQDTIEKLKQNCQKDQSLNCNNEPNTNEDSSKRNFSETEVKELSEDIVSDIREGHSCHCMICGNDLSISDSSEEIPSFTGCECMKEDYYSIMRIAYNKK